MLATKTALTTVENKIPDVSTLAVKTSLISLLPVSTFNNKVTKLEGKVTTADNKFSGFVKKTDYGAETTKIKNDYATNASLDSKLNDLKAQHIADEVKNVDDKTKKNASNILRFENRLKQKEDIVDENQRGLSFNRGFFYYIDQSYLVYDCKMGSFNFTGGKMSTWKSTGIFNYVSDSNMNAVGDSGNDLPDLENDGRIYVYLSGNHFQQNKVIIPNNNNVINIYCIYELQPIAYSRDTMFTVQNALFGAMQITKDATDNSKNNYKGYGICFDEGSQFDHTITEGGFAHTTNARNVLIFGADMSFSVHATNRANNIYFIGEGLTQGINDTTIYTEKSFTETLQILVKSLQ